MQKFVILNELIALFYLLFSNLVAEFTWKLVFVSFLLYYSLLFTHIHRYIKFIDNWTKRLFCLLASVNKAMHSPPYSKYFYWPKIYPFALATFNFAERKFLNTYFRTLHNPCAIFATNISFHVCTHFDKPLCTAKGPFSHLSADEFRW